MDKGAMTKNFLYLLWDQSFYLKSDLELSLLDSERFMTEILEKSRPKIKLQNCQNDSFCYTWFDVKNNFW